MKSDRTVLVLSQVYPPDPASVGQHMADVAVELARRGYGVRVITADRGYDDPTKKYANREMRDGVDVRRVRWSSFGKKSIPVRALAMLIFMFHCLWAGLTTRRLAGILVSTSPPMCGFAAGVTRLVRRVPIVYWVMDLNPDQMIELGKMKPDAPAAKVLNALQRFVLKRSAHVIALDRFMADRLYRKLSPAAQATLRAKMTVMPPWPHEDELDDVVEHADNWFRAQHGLDGKFVVMYSGNHGYSTPVTTVLQAALKLQQRDDIVFLFIGGGVGKKEVDQTIAERKPTNIRSLPYQPLKDLKFSLSAADVHLVTVGDSVVGVVHPCKVYGAMAVARPILLVAPDPCHASDLIRGNDCGWHISHGDVDGAVRTIETIAATHAERLREMGRRARGEIARSLSKKELCGRFCDITDQAFGGSPGSRAIGGTRA